MKGEAHSQCVSVPLGKAPGTSGRHCHSVQAFDSTNAHNEASCQRHRPVDDEIISEESARLEALQERRQAVAVGACIGVRDQHVSIAAVGHAAPIRATANLGEEKQMESAWSDCAMGC